VKPEEHVNLVAILHIAWGVLLLIASGVVMILLGAGGLLAEHEETAYIIAGIATFASGLLVVTAAAGIIGAWGLLRRRPWARLTVMVMSAIWLIKIPVGTALGIYSFYALTRTDVVALFETAAPST
jgi:hypothetical protein